MLDLLGGGVILLLAFLAATPQPKNEVKGRLLLDVVVGESAAIFQLLPGKDQTLLVRWDTWRKSYKGDVNKDLTIQNYLREHKVAKRMRF